MSTRSEALGAVAMLSVVLLTASACQREHTSANVQNETAEASPSVPMPQAERPMDRAAILLAAAKAGSAVALGEDDVAAQQELDGKTFNVRVRFGCASGGPKPAGEPAAAGPFNVRFDGSDRTLRIRASPDLTGDNPAIAALAGQSAEHVEGFWMRRPWQLKSGCPAAPAGSASADAADHRVGIAQFSTASDSRTERRNGRAYEATKVLEEGAQPSRQGYDLILSGRLRKLPGGRVISCQSLTANTPPECIISAQFDRVEIQTPDGKTSLGDWGR